MGPGDFADAEIDGLPGQDDGDVTIGMVIMAMSIDRLDLSRVSVHGCYKNHETRRKAQRLRFRSSLIRFLSSSISGRILLQ